MGKNFEQYILGKEFHSQIQELKKRGGAFTKAAYEAMDLILHINMKKENPFNHLNLTHHGETRIKHCIKYDLPGHVRLVTIQDNGVCLLAYIGNHNETDTWLESKKGLNLTIDTKNKTLVPVRISEDINQPEKRISAISDYSEGKLHKKLKTYYFTKIADKIQYSQLIPFLDFDATIDDDSLFDAARSIPDSIIQLVFFDVFLLLRSGDIEQAQNRILEFEDELTLVSAASKTEVESIQSNDQYINIQDLEAEYIKTLLDTKGWYEWMIFLHPMQKKVAMLDFKGAARLLGVSGSGKTSVLVHRAVRLAEKYPGKKILVLTLNKSLSRLIQKLVELLLASKNQSHLQEQIIVSSFWEICRDLIIDCNEEKSFTKRILTNITEKTGETIDDIWDEFYCKINNNDDAQILFPLHQTLLARNIQPQDYIRQEFDWIRSAFPKGERDQYMVVEREGRSIPFMDEDRKCVLAGLNFWEQKMSFVGAIDYLGLTNLLYEYIDKIEPKYQCILVDEVQDFGTIELKLVRKLVSPGENDLFLCGDIAQQVYNKQHKLRTAGITILPEGFLRMLKNYRNSREILQAAYCVFDKNVDREKFKSEDFEVLNPEFANYSSPKPFLRKGTSLNDEFSSAFEYLKQNLDLEKPEKGCIAICGVSMFELSKIATRYNLPILSGNNDLNEGNIFLSDLEQSKGFEFDKVVVINCSDTNFPNNSLPKEEWYREISKLYVAMTRAKKELILSYSDKYSHVFKECLDFFTEDQWKDHVNATETLMEISSIKTVEQENTALNIAGLDFLYSKNAKGLSRELQSKLIEVVAGKNVTDAHGRKIGWPTLEKLKSDVLAKRDIPTLTRTFGPTVFKELETLFSKS